MQQVSGKVAVVTGAASGIGRGMAETFAAAGMKVVLSDIESGPLEATTEYLRASGADVHCVVTDVANADQMESLAHATLQKYGAVHVLCNNAGVSVGSRPSWKSSLDDWQWIVGVNLMGVIHGVRTFLPVMIKQGGPAHIVNTASLAGLIYGENTLYSVTKAAVISLSESTQLELQQANLQPKISVLCPAYVNTNIMHAERNRPQALADSGPVPQGTVAEATREWVRIQIEQAMTPREVGDQVLAAIQEERFYVFTHADWTPLIEERMTRILGGQSPKPPKRPGSELLASMIEQAMRPRTN